MLSVKALIEQFQYALDNKFGYIWGTAGVLWTQERQNEVAKKTSSNYDMAKKYGSKWIGHYVADCSGLFAWAFKKLGSSIAHGSNSIWKGYLTEKGKITGPLTPGCAVFKLRNGSDYYHIGLYIGNNTVIEAKSTYYGVVTSKLSTWTHYGLLKGVDYGMKEPELSSGTAVVDVPNDGTVNVRTAPKSSAKILTRLPEGSTVNVERVDGDWAMVSYVETGYVMSKFLKKV